MGENWVSLMSRESGGQVPGKGVKGRARYKGGRGPSRFYSVLNP